MAIAGGYPDLSTLQNAGAATVSVRGAITYAAGTTGAIGATSLFTISGDVALTGLSAKCTTDLTSAGAPTFTLGLTGVADLLTKTYPDVTGWDSGEWADYTTPAYIAGGGKTTNLLGTQLPVLASGANIIQTIAVATITGGVVRWYVSYIPLSAGATVTRHANLAAF